MKSDSVAWAKLSLLFEVQMKIVVFADLHGNITAAERAVRLSFDEKADKTVFCGDIFGVWGSAQEIAEKLQQVCGIAYFVRGNNDFSCYDGYIAGGLEEYAVMYHFGRTLFFHTRRQVQRRACSACVEAGGRAGARTHPRCKPHCQKRTFCA